MSSLVHMRSKLKVVFPFKRISHLTSEASARLSEEWNGLAADVARGAEELSASLHLQE